MGRKTQSQEITDTGVMVNDIRKRWRNVKSTTLLPMNYKPVLMCASL
jgi:hypothetical protein